jgi:hypothetical protein
MISGTMFPGKQPIEQRRTAGPAEDKPRPWIDGLQQSQCPRQTEGPGSKTPCANVASGNRGHVATGQQLEGREGFGPPAIRKLRKNALHFETGAGSGSWNPRLQPAPRGQPDDTFAGHGRCYPPYGFFQPPRTAGMARRRTGNTDYRPCAPRRQQAEQSVWRRGWTNPDRCSHSPHNDCREGIRAPMDQSLGFGPHVMEGTIALHRTLCRRAWGSRLCNDWISWS